MGKERGCRKFFRVSSKGRDFVFLFVITPSMLLGTVRDTTHKKYRVLTSTFYDRNFTCIMVANKWNYYKETGEKKVFVCTSG